MRAVVTKEFGPAEVAQIEDIPRTEAKPDQVLIRVAASSVSTADWRLRAAAFPGALNIPGRLMFGIRRPKLNVLGMDFAGEVVAIGDQVQEFAKGDRVFGFGGSGGHAEYIVRPAESAMIKIPAGLSYEQAAATPFGGLSALVFLRDFAKLRAGEKVLVIGASGATGVFAMQIAKAMGAEVTGVASGANRALVQSLGGDHLDYAQTDYSTTGRRWDVILDTVGVTQFAQARRVLAVGGRFVPLNFGMREIRQALFTARFGRCKVVLGVSDDTRPDLEALRDLIISGQVRPVVDRVFPMAEIQAAYTHVESRHKSGAVILSTSGTSSANGQVA